MELRRRSSSAPIPYLCAISKSPRKTAKLIRAEKCRTRKQVRARKESCAKSAAPKAYLSGRPPPHHHHYHHRRVSKWIDGSVFRRARRRMYFAILNRRRSLYNRPPRYVLILAQRRGVSYVNDPLISLCNNVTPSDVNYILYCKYVGNFEYDTVRPFRRGLCSYHNGVIFVKGILLLGILF